MRPITVIEMYLFLIFTEKIFAYSLTLKIFFLSLIILSIILNQSLKSLGLTRLGYFFIFIISIL